MVGSQEGSNEEGEEVAASGNSTMLGQEYLCYGGAGGDVTTQYFGGVRDDVFIGAVETGHMEMGFEVCDVRRPLAAVSRMTSRGNRVVFGPEEEDNYIQHVESGKKIKMRKKGGAYVVDVVLLGSGQKTEITIDSAAEESVCPAEWANEFEMTKVKEGEEMSLVSANGGKINHHGRRKVIFEAPVF